MIRTYRNKERMINKIPIVTSLCLIMTFVLMLAVPDVQAGVPITLYQSFAGNINFTGTGGTLRAQSNPVNPCSLNASSTGNLAGIPASATVTAAYLYWAGSYDNAQGVPPDYNVSLNGNNITADRTFTETFVFGTTYNFFSGFTDVTAIVAAAGNGNYTFTNLTVNNGAPHCGVSAVLSGWSLVVLYGDAAEPLRVINVFDGFQYYRGSQITLTPGNFRIPNAGIDGLQSHISWEGDVENSAPLGGFNENLVFNGNSLTDGLNPLNNQFNSTINYLGSNTTYGVDHDVYNITPYLSPGDTSATSNYSSGADLVLLSVEVISVTNTEVADLAIVKSHSGNFNVGQTGSYSILVSNNGPSAVSSSITVTDTLPAGLTYLSSSGSGWIADTSGNPIIAWTHPGPLASSSSLPAISLSVDVLPAAAPTVTNIAAVASSTFDNISANDISSDLTTVLSSDLSTSTKTVMDQDGGDADPGDTLRYTITMVESGGAAASSIAVMDNLPANTTSLTVVSFPSGATNSSTAVLLDISNITVSAGGSDTIVFDVIVSGSANPGDLVDNTATITNPGGLGATPAAPTIIVSQSQIPANGNKPLYLTANTLTRVVPGALGNVTINEGATINWILNPALGTTLTVDGSSGNVPVTLVLGEAGGGQRRSYTISLSSSAIGTFATLSLTNVDLNPTITVTYNLPLTSPGDKILPAGSTITLAIVNDSTGGGNRRVIVTPNGSFVDLPSNTVVNVDSALFYDSAYPGGTSVTTTTLGSTVYVRAVVSDPFGSFDITSSNVTILNPLGVPVVSSVAMTQVADSGAATKTYEYTYIIPAGGPGGTWTAQVVANEGSEGTVTHQRNTTVTIPVADLAVVKSHTGTFTVGQNGFYNILVSNNGPNDEPGSVTVTDTLPTGLNYLSSSGMGWVADTTSLPTVIWTHPGSVTAGSTMPDITLTVDVTVAAIPTVSNIAAVAHSTFDNIAANDISSDLTTVNGVANLSIMKLVQVTSDPNPGTTVDKSVPGAEMLYSVFIANTGLGVAGTDSVVITDNLSPNTVLYVGDLTGPGTGPVDFNDGVVASGLSYNYSALASTTDDVDFSNDGGATYNHLPISDVDGYDIAVPPTSAIRINPKGAMNASDGVNNPSFDVRYQVRVE